MLLLACSPGSDRGPGAGMIADERRRGALLDWVDANPEQPRVSGYTHINLKDVEQPTGTPVPGMERRFGRSRLDSEHLGVSYFRYDPGVRSPLAHSHREQEEAYVVTAGSGRIRLDDELRDLRPWDVVRVSPATVRAFEAGPEGLELVAVGADRPEGGDGVAVEPAWVDE